VAWTACPHAHDAALCPPPCRHPATPPAQLDMGSLYYGQNSEADLVLFNNGPVEARYIISYGTLAEMRSKV
jgi:hypothetical protein